MKMYIPRLQTVGLIIYFQIYCFITLLLRNLPYLPPYYRINLYSGWYPRPSKSVHIFYMNYILLSNFTCPIFKLNQLLVMPLITLPIPSGIFFSQNFAHQNPINSQSVSWSVFLYEALKITRFKCTLCRIEENFICLSPGAFN